MVRLGLARRRGPKSSMLLSVTLLNGKVCEREMSTIKPFELGNDFGTVGWGRLLVVHRVQVYLLAAMWREVEKIRSNLRSFAPETRHDPGEIWHGFTLACQIWL